MKKTSLVGTKRQQNQGLPARSGTDKRISYPQNAQAVRRKEVKQVTHSDFLAKTFVAQAKAYKRFRIEDMYYSALDTLNHAYDDKIISCLEWHEAHEYFQNFIYGELKTR